MGEDVNRRAEAEDYFREHLRGLGLSDETIDAMFELSRLEREVMAEHQAREDAFAKRVRERVEEMAPAWEAALRAAFTPDVPADASGAAPIKGQVPDAL